MLSSENETYVLLPILERYIPDILEQRKIYELRTMRIPAPQKALLYACGPKATRKIVAMCGLSAGVPVTPDLQDDTIRGACITREEFDEYSYPPGKYPRVVYRHLIAMPRRLREPIALASLGIDYAPRSWRYVTADPDYINLHI